MERIPVSMFHGVSGGENLSSRLWSWRAAASSILVAEEGHRGATLHCELGGVVGNRNRSRKQQTLQSLEKE